MHVALCCGNGILILLYKISRHVSNSKKEQKGGGRGGTKDQEGATPAWRGSSKAERQSGQRKR